MRSLRKNVIIGLLIVVIISMLFALYKYEVSVRAHKMQLLDISSSSFVNLATHLGAQEFRDFKDVYFQSEASEMVRNALYTGWWALRPLSNRHQDDYFRSFYHQTDHKLATALRDKDYDSIEQLGEASLEVGRALSDLYIRRQEGIIASIQFYNGRITASDMDEVIMVIKEQMQILDLELDYIH